MEKTVVEQERDLKDLIRRAKATPDRTGTLPRDTLKRLIELTHSTHPSLRIHAAEGIRFFFNDFPDLEEEAINAVYDLCEDQSQRVRIEGYKAITLVSKAQVKWVKRNADVLVQLLQSDEPDEVLVVKQALVEHLDLDARITMTVLCDQINPPDDLMDEDEIVLRDRLRSLVLAFLTGMAKRAVIRHASPASETEEVLHTCFVKALPKLTNEEIESVIKDLLLALPGYQNNSARGKSLMSVLLGKAEECMQNELRKGKTVTLQSTRFYLNIANLLVEKKVSPPLDLMRLYLASFASKMTLQQLDKDDQAMILSSIANTVSACENCNRRAVDATQLSSIRRQAVDACPILLEQLADSGSKDTRSRQACTKLLRACVQRKQSSDWAVPPNLVTALNAVTRSPMAQGDSDIQGLIRVRNGPLLIVAACVKRCFFRSL
ncbi:hypothetical protein HGRIS_003037 [Hohenbuehelia grisea]|uniref:Uncharacterized protein n=1 Tax=Hohenbuehelia grisea TaxID=104357 RepID=A0ABR3JP88_9AGAR